MTEDETVADLVAAIEALLVRTEQAHGVFESTELEGVYDQEWPRWYAVYAVEHGIGEILGGGVTVDELAEFLARSNAEFEAIDPKPSETWATYAARRISAEL
jgi:hypothetical protein